MPAAPAPPAPVAPARAPETTGEPAGEEELAARLRVAVTRLHRRLRAEALAGVSPSQASALGSISRLGRPTLGELAQAELVQPPTMTKVVASMEAAGLVVRHGDGDDRRVSRVELSEAGVATLAQIRTLKNAYLAQRLAELPTEERALAAPLTALLERLLAE